MYKLFLTVRYLRKRRIAYFAVAAVTLCVAMVLIVMSVMGGWLEQVKKQARGMLGDIIVDNRDYAGFPLYEEFIDEVSQWDEVVRATPVIYTAGLVRFPNTGHTGKVNIVGIRLDEVYEVNKFRSGLFYEKYYPGTTSLSEQDMPVIGQDLDAEPISTADGERAFRPFELPEPEKSAYAAARSSLKLERENGTNDFGVLDGSLNSFLRENGQAPIPGFFEYRVEEPPARTGDKYPGLIVGKEIVAKREADGRYKQFYPRGSLVTVTLWATSIDGSVDPIPLKQPFRFADESRTGIFEIDSQHVYCDFDLLQRLLQMDAAERVDPESGAVLGKHPARCSQIQMKIAPGVDALALCDRLEKTMHGYMDDARFELDEHERRLLSRVEALTWEQSQAQLIMAVEKEKILVTILFGIISLVAVALILCILYMIVLQKTRDIGIVKAIGGSSGGVAAIFVTYGASVGLVGCVLGTTLGTLFVTYINEIQDVLIRINPAWRVWDMQVYSFDRIPNQVQLTDVLVIILIALAASTIGSLAAAWRAGTMQPVEALRYE